MSFYLKDKIIYFITHNSLLNRFFIASLLILPLFIVLSGTLLSNTFKHSQIDAEKEKLQAQLYLLLSVTEIEAQQPILPDALTEPRLNQTHSGLYGFILDSDNQELWRSPSAELLPQPFVETRDDFQLNQRLFFPFSHRNMSSDFFGLSYDTEWFTEENKAQSLRFFIMSDAAALNAELQSYRSRLWQWLGTMGIALILAQVLIMRWGLQPLKRLSQELKQLQKHDIDQLDSNYPTEIQPVINDFNGILVQEKQQRERYRNTMSDLAHSLKTPLAVIQSQLGSQAKYSSIDQQKPANSGKTIHDQIERINQIITHQLQRAVIRINQNSLNQSTTNHNTHKISVKTMVDRLLKTMAKVYHQKNITFTNLAETNSLFFGDEADLLEILGNLIDNACKHGHNAVTVTAKNNNEQLVIGVSDNGKGVESHQRGTILQRGERADTAQPGQGLGLSVAVDIISSYGGEIKVSSNAPKPHLSGACFEVRLDFV